MKSSGSTPTRTSTAASRRSPRSRRIAGGERRSPRGAGFVASMDGWLRGDRLAGGAGHGRLLDLDQPARAHVVQEAVDRDGRRDEGMVADTADVVHDGPLLVVDAQPVDVLAEDRAGALADVREPVRAEPGCLEAGLQQLGDLLVREELHAAVGVVDDEELAGAEELVADDQRADGVVACPPAGITDDVGVALG